MPRDAIGASSDEKMPAVKTWTTLETNHNREYIAQSIIQCCCISVKLRFNAAIPEIPSQTTAGMVIFKLR